jgi:serine/threonine-protein kinase
VTCRACGCEIPRGTGTLVPSFCPDCSEAESASGATSDDGDAALAAAIEEFEARGREGATPDIEEFCARHPAIASRLRKALQITAALTRLESRPEAPEPPSMPARLGPYTILAPLGRGAMASVWRASDARLGRDVALKVLSPGSEHLAVRRERFLREARALARIDHPNVVPIHDVGEDPPYCYLAMELMDGSLADRLEGGLEDTRARQVAGWILDAAHGLARAHAEGILHRDIKPHNLLMGRDGRVRVGDFGLARLEGDETLTASRQIVGTLRYAAPEQIRGDVATPRGDVYALGATLYHLAVGAPPTAAVGRERGSAAALRTLPRALRAIAAKAMAHDPEGRYPDMDSFAADLRAFLEGRSPRAMASPRRWWVIGAGLIGAAGATLAVALARRPSTAAPPPLAARHVITFENQPFTPSSNPAAMRAFHDAMALGEKGTWRSRLRAFEEAIAADPSFWGAHLYAAMTANGLKAQLRTEDRRHFSAARDRRDQLGSREQKLVDALTPGFVDPPDWDEEARLLEGFVAASPACDLPVLHLLGTIDIKRGEYEKAILSLTRAWECDKDFTNAAALIAQAQRMGWNFPAARTVAEECLARDPGAAGCVRELHWLLADAGECTEADARARRYVGLHPDDASGFLYRADAAAGMRAEPTTLEALLRSADEHAAPSARAREEVVHRALVARYRGAFDEALRALDELDRLPSPTHEERDLAAQLRAGALIEIGEKARAGQVCRRRADEAEGEVRPEQISADNLPPLWSCARDGGALATDEMEKRRDAWVASWKARVPAGVWEREKAVIVWVSGFATAVTTPSDAEEALARAPELHAPPPFASEPGQTPEIGVVYELAGQHARALPFLERGARHCWFMPEYFGGFEPRFDLFAARAHEALGHAAEACAFYQRVLDRWGKALPRSVTAEAARAGASHLRCSGPPSP